MFSICDLAFRSSVDADYYRYRYCTAKVTVLLILGSVLPHASFSV